MGQSAFTLAWTRFIDITIGIVAAVAVGSLVWPNHARVRYFRGVSSTLEQTTSYCEHLLVMLCMVLTSVTLDLRMSR
jgi:uncharacterized membrane protein YccC